MYNSEYLLGEKSPLKLLAVKNFVEHTKIKFIDAENFLRFLQLCSVVTPEIFSLALDNAPEDFKFDIDMAVKYDLISGTRFISDENDQNLTAMLEKIFKLNEDIFSQTGCMEFLEKLGLVDKAETLEQSPKKKNFFGSNLAMKIFRFLRWSVGVSEVSFSEFNTLISLCKDGVIEDDLFKYIFDNFIFFARKGEQSLFGKSFDFRTFCEKCSDKVIRFEKDASVSEEKNKLARRKSEDAFIVSILGNLVKEKTYASHRNTLVLQEKSGQKETPNTNSGEGVPPVQTTTPSQKSVSEEKVIEQKRGDEQIVQDKISMPEVEPVVQQEPEVSLTEMFQAAALSRKLATKNNKIGLGFSITGIISGIGLIVLGALAQVFTFGIPNLASIALMAVGGLMLATSTGTTIYNGKKLNEANKRTCEIEVPLLKEKENEKQSIFNERVVGQNHGPQPQLLQEQNNPEK